MPRPGCRAGAALAGTALVRAAEGVPAGAGPGDLPVPGEGPAEARRRAQEILARPELRPEPKPLVERVLDELGELLDEVAGSLGGISPVLAWAIVGVVGGLLGLVLWRAVRALQAEPGARGGVGIDGRRRPPADWRAEAAAHEAAGRWREALRCSWRAVVAELASLGLLEEVPGRTTGEHRRALARSLPGGAADFSRATRLFEDAWYAAAEVGRAEAVEVRDLGDRVLAQARARS